MASSKIALCFLVNDRDARETVPRTTGFPQMASLLADPRFNVYALYTSPSNQPNGHVDSVFKTRAIPVRNENYIKTEYGKASLAEAAVKMFEFARNHDPANASFVLLSESCLPLWSPDVIYSVLTCHIKGSWLSNWTPGQLRAGQQCVLSRDHLDTMIEAYRPYLTNMESLWAPDERLFITVLKDLGLSNVLHKDEGPVLADWERPTGSSPFEFDQVSRDDVFKLLATDALFCRKVSRGSSLKNLAHMFLKRSIDWWTMSHYQKGSTHHLSNVFKIM